MYIWIHVCTLIPLSSPCSPPNIEYAVWCMYTYTYIYVYTHVCTYKYICPRWAALAQRLTLNTPSSLCTYIYMHTCMYVRASYTRIYIYIKPCPRCMDMYFGCIHMYINIYMHVCILYIYIHQSYSTALAWHLPLNMHSGVYAYECVCMYVLRMCIHMYICAYIYT